MKQLAWILPSIALPVGMLVARHHHAADHAGIPGVVTAASILWSLL